MAQKKKSKKRRNRGNNEGHYCWVCGEHKANEKFSGRGHATHMCRQCHALPVAERNQMVAIRKIHNMTFRYLTEQEIKWLRKRMNDPRPEVREAACEAHSIKFPRYERNSIKKRLTANSLEFLIHSDVWDADECEDEIPVHMRFFADNRGNMRRIDYFAPEGKRETSINIGQQAAIKFLKAVVHQLDAPFWSEDLSDGEQDDFDPYLEDDFDDDWEDDLDEDEADSEQPETSNDDREPVCCLTLMLTKGLGEQTQTFYNQLHEPPQDLFWSLMEWFEEADKLGKDEFDASEHIDPPEILLETTDGIVFEKVSSEKRCKVIVKDKDTADIHMVYRFNNIASPFLSPYISWDNLNCCDGWIFHESYLLTAVQDGKKLCAGLTFDSKDEADAYKDNLILPSFCYSSHKYYFIDVVRDGALCDYFNKTDVLTTYEALGIKDFDKNRISELFKVPMINLLKDRIIDYAYPSSTEEWIITGLLLGYPLESTAWLLEKRDWRDYSIDVIKKSRRA